MQNIQNRTPKWWKNGPRRGSDSTFSGCLARLGRVSALGSILVPFTPLSWEPPGRLLGLLGHLLAAKLPLKTHVKAGEKNIQNRFSLRSAWKPFRWVFSSLQGAKMEASWLQNSLPLGPCLKNGVNLRNTTIPIFKIRFWRVQGHAFSINFGYFFDLC